MPSFFYFGQVLKILYIIIENLYYLLYKSIKFTLMASKHQLSLELPDSNNIKVFRLVDTSSYAEEVGVDCGTLQITSPGFNLPVSIEVTPRFNLILNGCTLGIQRTGCGEVSQILPDGIYIIRYSVSPHASVYVEYNHLRATQTLNRYYNLLSQLELSACEPDADVKEQLEELRMIKSFIDAAKAKVEYSHEAEKGMELFVYAKKRLDKLTAKVC